MHRKDPVNSVGKISEMIDNVPIIIGIRERFMMPQRTLVGQSGPPIRITTLATPKPLSRSTCFVALINIVLIPTNYLTLTLQWSRPLIFFYCTVHVNSLRIKDETNV